MTDSGKEIPNEESLTVENLRISNKVNTICEPEDEIGGIKSTAYFRGGVATLQQYVGLRTFMITESGEDQGLQFPSDFQFPIQEISDIGYGVKAEVGYATIDPAFSRWVTTLSGTRAICNEFYIFDSSGKALKFDPEETAKTHDENFHHKVMYRELDPEDYEKIGFMLQEVDAGNLQKSARWDTTEFQDGDA